MSITIQIPSNRPKACRLKDQRLPPSALLCSVGELNNDIYQFVGNHDNLTDLFIRYELDDTATYTHEPCGCGLPFHRITRIGGRVAETLRIRAKDGTVAILHVIDFDEILTVNDVKAWQVVCHKDRLDVLLLSPLSPSRVKEVESRVSEMMSQKGLADFSCNVRVVDQIPRLKSGKIALVRDAR